jgi:hypothetical protein
MTEDEWAACEDTLALLNFSRRKVSERKFRLLSCVLCKANNQFMGLRGARELVRAVEEWAEGDDRSDELASMLEALDLSPASPTFDRSRGAMRLGFCSKAAFNAAVYTVSWSIDDEPTSERFCTKTIREIFGNPFRPVTFNAAWRTSTVVALATGIYDERAFDRLPILADALQDAGCDADDLLNHLRDPAATHVRGCWALDLVLGKT